ncbi:MAG: hypothetical protein K0R25_1118 [Rickettsiaceae bacterium]|jgi:uncharacterized membrane protein (UPF0127 family)|nr:hypothetical protein [Rickettsiaceae bacterium]
MKLSKKLIRLFTTSLFLIALSGFSAKQPQHKYNNLLQIKNIQSGKINNFFVKIAKTEKDRETGLMWVENLPENCGMIFEFEREQIISMWMKNTKIPLDMIFIDQNGMVVDIKSQTKPESLEIISSNEPAIKVLEINGGLVQKLGIKIGDKVI